MRPDTKQVHVAVCAAALQEPAKAELLAYESGHGPVPPRQALVVLQVPAIPSVYELLVDLGQDKVLKAKKVSNQQKLQHVMRLGVVSACGLLP